MRRRHIAVLALATLLGFPAFAQTSAPSGSTHSTATSASKPAPSGNSAATTHSSSAQGKLLDINTASASELDALPGIGKARANAIIKGRPYRAKDDLATRHIIPQSVYDGIKDKIVARQG